MRENGQTALPDRGSAALELYEGTVHLHLQGEGSRRLEVNFLQQVRYMFELRVLRVTSNTEGGVDVRVLLRQPTPLRHMLVNMEGVSDVRPAEEEASPDGGDDSHLTVTLSAPEMSSDPSQNWSPCVSCKGLIEPAAKVCPYCHAVQR